MSIYSSERLEKIFEQCRKRIEKKNELEKEQNKKKVKKTHKKVEKERKKKKVKEKNEKLERGTRMAYIYHYNDTKDNLDGVCNFDGQWMVDNIFQYECIYCGESDWRLLGCDRINNNKGHTKDNVVCCCKRCNKLRSNKFTVDEMKEIGSVIKRIENRRKDYSIRRGRPVACYDDDGNLVKEYPCAAQVQEDGYNARGVRKACEYNQFKHTNRYKGLYWNYIEKS